jgi:hypothetical protein
MELWYDGSRQDDIQEGVNTMVKFADFSDAEQAIVGAIVERAINTGIYNDALTAEMDIAAVYVHCPLRLSDLVIADQFNFAHDLRGIQKHINRNTGELENFFLPRFAR